MKVKNEKSRKDIKGVEWRNASNGGIVGIRHKCHSNATNFLSPVMYDLTLKSP